MSSGSVRTDGEAGHHSLVEVVNESAGCRLQFVGSAVHGETGGAAYVRWPDGREGVVTRAPLSVERAQQTADVLSELWSAGLPVPRHDLLVEIPDGTVAVVQERLPGAPAARTNVAVIDAMVAMNERFAGLLANRPDVPIPALYLRESGPVFPRHEVLAGHSERSRRLLDRIHEVGASEPKEMVGDDLVHTDFTVPNLLFDESGEITGVVDWNFGVARGDRRFGLVKLLFDLTWAVLYADDDERSETQGAIDRVTEVLEQTVEPDLLRMYWAHWTLTMLHWTIRSGVPEVIDLHLDLGESRLGSPRWLG
jgi:aminoglycoside phosphotransferase (APT) family kinase protein